MGNKKRLMVSVEIRVEDTYTCDFDCKGLHCYRDVDGEWNNYCGIFAEFLESRKLSYFETKILRCESCKRGG